MDQTPESLGCGLTTDALDDRRAAWGEVEVAIVDRVHTDDGFRVRFAHQGDTGERLHALVAAETECCGWAAWTVTDTEGLWVLDVTGPSTRIAPLAAAFGVGRR